MNWQQKLLQLAMLLLSMPALAQSPSSRELLFEVGFWSFINNDCASAITPFAKLATRPDYSGRRSRVYLAHCQYKLGYKDLAANNMYDLETDGFNQAERKMHSQLKRKLRHKLARFDQPYGAFAPYYGTASFSEELGREAGSFFGFSGTWGKRKYNLNIGYEAYSLGFTTEGVDTYSQQMFHLRPGVRLGKNWWGSASYTSISSNYDQFDAISVLGVQTDATVYRTIAFGLEAFSSQYPAMLSDDSSNSVPLSVLQYGASVKGRIYSGKKGAWWATLMQSVQSYTFDEIASSATDVMDTSPSRTDLALNYYASKFNLELGTWSGSESLGVRNDGSVIFSGTEERLGGWRAALNIVAGDNSTVGLAVANESFKSSGIDYETTTYTGMLNLTF